MTTQKPLAAALLAAAVLSLAACSAKNGSVPPAALTENDFAADPTLSLAPDQVGVTFLEAADSSMNDGLPDTGTVGEDVIPFSVTEAGIYTYALDPEDTTGTIAKVELYVCPVKGKPCGSGGNGGVGTFLLATLTPASPTVSLVLQPGTYAMAVYAGYGAAEESSGARAVFMHRNVASTSSASSAGLERENRAPHASEKDVTTFISTWICPGCDLSGMNLAYKGLTGAPNGKRANLSRANLSRANLSCISLTGADLSRANLKQALLLLVYMADANLAGADLTEADLTAAEFPDADLSAATLVGARLSSAALTRAKLEEVKAAGVNLEGAKLQSANLARAFLKNALLYQANLTNADFSGADLTLARLGGATVEGAIWAGADLSGAIWTDYRTCAPGSIGTCK